jgi:uncharacterized membrane protein HdeD (DUF308 family)
MLFGDKQKDTSSWLRTIYNYTMGVLWLAAGIFFLFHRKWGYDLKLNNSADVLLTNIFGASAVLYGLFRIYRGYKKQ